MIGGQVVPASIAKRLQSLSPGLVQSAYRGWPPITPLSNPLAISAKTKSAYKRHARFTPSLAGKPELARNAVLAHLCRNQYEKAIHTHFCSNRSHLVAPSSRHQ